MVGFIMISMKEGSAGGASRGSDLGSQKSGGARASSRSYYSIEEFQSAKSNWWSYISGFAFKIYDNDGNLIYLSKRFYVDKIVEIEARNDLKNENCKSIVADLVGKFFEKTSGMTNNNGTLKKCATFDKMSRLLHEKLHLELSPRGEKLAAAAMAGGSVVEIELSPRGKKLAGAAMPGGGVVERDSSSQGRKLAAAAMAGGGVVEIELSPRGRELVSAAMAGGNKTPGDENSVVIDSSGGLGNPTLLLSMSEFELDRQTGINTEENKRKTDEWVSIRNFKQVYESGLPTHTVSHDRTVRFDEKCNCKVFCHFVGKLISLSVPLNATERVGRNCRRLIYKRDQFDLFSLENQIKRHPFVLVERIVGNIFLDFINPSIVHLKNKYSNANKKDVRKLIGSSVRYWRNNQMFDMFHLLSSLLIPEVNEVDAVIQGPIAESVRDLENKWGVMEICMKNLNGNSESKSLNEWMGAGEVGGLLAPHKGVIENFLAEYHSRK